VIHRVPYTFFGVVMKYMLIVLFVQEKR
jgi:hypothetical protein